MILVAVQVTRNLLKMALRTVSMVHSNSPAMNHMSTIRKTDPITLCLLGIEVSFPVIGVYEKLGEVLRTEVGRRAFNHAGQPDLESTG